MAAIVLSQLTKQYAATAAVRDISFSVPSGSFTVLLGPSGCGKSTTLRMIAGLDTPTSGRIMIGERDVTHLPPAKRRVAMVFQSYALFPHLTVRENILFGLRVRKERSEDFPRRVDRVASLLGLTALLERKPAQLSGGQQQRVALGRAVISEAPVCLMDEPLSNLDAQLRQEMRREIRALQQQLGITMVYVTHDQTEAMSMADRVILMRQGKVEQAGAPNELYERPASTFVAGFIGVPPMNVIELDDRGLIAGTDFAATDSEIAGLQLGIRPEHIEIGRAGLPAKVETSEYFGADSIVACSIGHQRINLRVPGPPSLSTGAEVHLRLKPECIHFFDRETTLRRDDVRLAASMQ